MKNRYNHKKIEAKWQKKWEEDGLYQADLDKAKKPFYNLMMFPYPSAEGLHVGNMYAFVHSDTYGRFMRLRGYDVFEPIGLDGFGIHSENYAIKIKEHIKDVSARTEKHFYKQLHMIGNAYDWSRTVETYKPNYYKWTQWLFLQMYKKGLAYRKKSSVNWCPSCKTVLSDEQVITGRCERCSSETEKRQMEQWFWRITDYAEKLLKNLETIDWSEEVKTIQKNWIGRSEGAVVRFQISDFRFQIEVFTTRPDTLFGATYFVLSPEHPLVEKITSPEQKEAVEKYIKEAASKSELERTELAKEKTGVFTGAYAINPANNAEIPIFIANYVLAEYGTGAIMAVPAHDERDFEFAKKYNLPIIQVVTPNLNSYKATFKTLEVLKDINNVARERDIKLWLLGGLACAFYAGIIYREHDDLDLIVKDKKQQQEVTGLLDELGFKKVREKKLSDKLTNIIYKSKNDIKIDIGPYIKEFGMTDNDFEEDEKELNGIKSLVISKRFIKHFKEFQLKNRTKEKDRIDMEYLNGKVFAQDGFSVNSGILNNLSTSKAIKKITKWLKDKNLGRTEVDYKLRDWCISRQRYWGPPIPMIECEKCGWNPVSEKDLPVLLPEMDDFLPDGSGKGPLNKIKEFVNTTCPKCGGSAKRETDVSDPFVDSSWYFMRYLCTDFDNKGLDKKRLKKWMPVNMYIGGKEHSVLHLLYSRFVTMVMHEQEFAPEAEPYKQFRAHGLLIAEGAKISKSKGNIINPDEYIDKYGADAVRMYLMFLGDMRQGGDWRDSGMAGMYKFINRIWSLFKKLEYKSKTTLNKSRFQISDFRFQNDSIKKLLHKTIKGVGKDLENLKYNTAIAKLMILANKIQEVGCTKEEFSKFVILLSPFAPHLAEELWSSFVLQSRTSEDKEDSKYKQSIFKQSWPEYDKKLVKDKTINLVVQVNGKLRDTIEVEANISEEKAKKVAQESEKIKKWTKDKKIVKIIFVKSKLVNIVIK